MISFLNRNCLQGVGCDMWGLLLAEGLRIDCGIKTLFCVSNSG